MKTSDIVQEITASVIAVVAVVGTFAVVSYELINNKPLQVPDVASLLVGAIIGAYFTKASSQNGARQAGTAAAQTAVAAANEARNAGSSTSAN